MTYQEIRILIEQMEQGDDTALEILQSESAKQAKRANVRLKALEEHNYSTPASRRAFGFLDLEDRARFSESKNLTGESLEQQLEELNLFLSGPSTISEAREYLAGLDKLQENDVIDDFVDNHERGAFLRFLESDYWNDLKLTMGKGSSPPGSKEALQAAQDAIRSGATVNKLKKAYQDFKDREMRGNLKKDEDILSVFENWAKVKL